MVKCLSPKNREKKGCKAMFHQEISDWNMGYFLVGGGTLQRHPESRDCLKRIGAQQGLLCSVPFPVRHLGEDLLSSFHWGGVGKIRWVSRSVCIEMPFGAESRGFFLFLSRKGSVYLDLCVYMWFSGRKWRGTKECLDEGERREWKRWLETQHLKN